MRLCAWQLHNVDVMKSNVLGALEQGQFLSTGLSNLNVVVKSMESGGKNCLLDSSTMHTLANTKKKIQLYASDASGQ